MRKLEMAVLYGGPGGFWDTLIVEVEAPALTSQHNLEELGREKLNAMEEHGELDEFSGSYLYSYGMWLDEDDQEEECKEQYDEGFAAGFEAGGGKAHITPIMLVHDELIVEVRPILNADYWDCECEQYYIHKKTRSPAIMINTGACPICNAVEADQPDSHAKEIGRPLTMALHRPYKPCH